VSNKYVEFGAEIWKVAEPNQNVADFNNRLNGRSCRIGAICQIRCIRRRVAGSCAVPGVAVREVGIKLKKRPDTMNIPLPPPVPT
jgi:hypothetical protein